MTALWFCETQLADGTWAPRTADRPTVRKSGGVEYASEYGPRLRAGWKPVAIWHEHLSLDELQAIYGEKEPAA